MKKFAITVVCFFVVALLTGAHRVGAQATCNPGQLATSCAEAFFLQTAPSTECCNKLRAQQPCYCTYLKDPQLKGLVGSDAARKIAKSCGITFPTLADCPPSPA